MSPTRHPSAIVIIPARGGSERVPGKNLLPLAGIPLLAHSILHARGSKLVQEVIVSTDNPKIAEVAKEYGATVIKRPHDLANAKATSESALLHVLDERKKKCKADPDLVVFLQCTSPVRKHDDIDNAITQLINEDADSLFSATRNHAFIWNSTPEGPQSLTYDHRTRKREQDMEVQYRENGSIYVTKTAVLRANGNRLGGKMTVYLMDEMHSFQVDTPAQVDLLRWVVRREIQDWPKDIDLIVFDFDGVMTDNTVLTRANGHESVRCNRGDGLGIASLRRAGIPMIVLSTEEHPVVAARCKKLKLPCFQGLQDKAAFLKKYTKKEKIDLKRTAYLGNDVNDLSCLEIVGLPVVTADAHPDVMHAAHVVLSTSGGKGAVREFADKMLAARKKK
ncbi:MAG: N-acylneuraminate cytidylyltransferase [Candidatus Peregrinibacteria bacterium Greene1014_49]|nr:MAG: N-acylneuraminate cytidylyltransferase [Candidatus Peregrinibacteria bacterium Greene1014_49]